MISALLIGCPVCAEGQSTSSNAETLIIAAMIAVPFMIVLLAALGLRRVWRDGGGQR